MSTVCVQATNSKIAPTDLKLIPFKKEKLVEERTRECNRVRTKYPDLIPVICERHGGSTMPQSIRRKYLVPRDITLGQFQFVIRKRIQMCADQALFLFVDGTVICSTMMSLGEIYNKYKDVDGFLYIIYSGESTFGSRQESIILNIIEDGDSKHIPLI